MEQSLALKILKDGNNVFLTGAAGTGKTYVLNEFIEWCESEGRPAIVTASTGIAATHIGGETIHRAAGIRIYDELPTGFFKSLNISRRVQIANAETLIIDEISMLHAHRLELVDQVFRRVRRKRDQPFGGIQVVFCGDFFQLPPVNSSRSEIQSGFAYESNAWGEANLKVCYLDKQYRQTDAEYCDILNRIRSRTITDFDRHRIATRIGQEVEGFDNQALIHLYTRNRNVDQLNDTKLEELAGEEFSFLMREKGQEVGVKTLKSSRLEPEVLRLKNGCEVMALRNDPLGRFTNGSIGEVVAFKSVKQVADGGGSEEISGELADASQRSKSEFANLEYPLVEFADGSQVLMTYEGNRLEAPGVRTVTDEEGNEREEVAMETVATIWQIPLRLAYAITVHKSQGMTLDAARIDLHNVFEPGMGYVALSRIKELSKLSLIAIDESAVKVSDSAFEMDELFQAKSAALETGYAPPTLI